MAATTDTAGVDLIAVWCRVAWCGPIELHLAAPHETLSLNEPVIATLLVRNTAGESTYLELDAHGRQHVNVNVLHAKGDPLYVTADAARTCLIACTRPLARGRVLGASEGSRGIAGAGQVAPFRCPWQVRSLRRTFKGRRFVDIFAVRQEHVEELDGVPSLMVSDEDVAWLEEAVVRSNTVTITIGSRDERRLRAVARDLLAAAEARDYSARFTLAWMMDSVAVPALAGLIGLDQGYRAEVSAAIERTASSDAVDVLLQLGTPNGPLGRTRVRHVLERIISSRTSVDPAARKRAEEAIERMISQEGELTDCSY